MGCGLADSGVDQPGSTSGTSPGLTAQDSPLCLNFGLNHPGSGGRRFTTPLKRNCSGQLVPVDWDMALREFVGRIKEIQWRCGRQSIGFLAPGQLALEEVWSFQVLARQGIGARLGAVDLRSPVLAALEAYRRAYGNPLPPYAFEDLEESDVVVLVGSDLAQTFPELWQRLLKNSHAPEIIVIDSRQTLTSRSAGQHLQPHPGTECSLLSGLAQVLIERGAVDQEFIAAQTEGFGELQTQLRHSTLHGTAAETRLSPSQMELLASSIARGERVSFWWSTAEIGASGANGIEPALINLALLTGNVGRPGTGANAILGPCTALGTFLFGNFENMRVSSGNDAAAGRFVSSGSQSGNLTWLEVCEGITRHEIKALWLVSTNAAAGAVDELLTREILDQLDFLVVQDTCEGTLAAACADLILPSAGWGEKTGTFLTTERRLGLATPVREPPGNALADFEIFRTVAHYWGCEKFVEDWDRPESVFQLLKEISRDTPWEFTGIEDYAQIETLGGVQIPAVGPIASSRREKRLLEDGRFPTSTGRASFLPQRERHEKSGTPSRFPV